MLLFSDVPIPDRFQYYDDNISIYSLLIIPLVIGFLLAIASPWARWFFVWAAYYPSTKRVLVQAKSEQAILDEKNSMTLARTRLQATTEESLISEAQRDEMINTIENDEVREKLQLQIDQIRDQMRHNDMTIGELDQHALLRLDLEERGNGYRFVLTNISGATAKNIDFTLEIPKGKDDPVPKSEYDKFPVPMLSPGASLTLMAGIRLGSATSYTANVSWDNPNGKRAKEQLFASL